jgi:hypothetical protein
VRIITALAFCAVTCGTALATRLVRQRRGSRVSRLLTGSTFLFGFVLAGVALSQWDVN